MAITIRAPAAEPDWTLTPGLDTMTAQPRLTFGSSALLGGVSYVAVMIGMFGIAEALAQLHTVALPAVKQQVDRIVPSLATVRRHLPLTIRASAIGVWIGALPGAGGPWPSSPAMASKTSTSSLEPTNTRACALVLETTSRKGHKSIMSWDPGQMKNGAL